MLTPKTIAMNAANAPHWTLYRRTANRRNQPRTIPMRMRPTWLMSIAFPRRMGEIPRIPDKGVGAVLTRNNDATPGEPAARLNYLGARCPTGVALVRFDRVSRLRHRERCDEHLLRELRDPSWLGPRGGTRRARGRSATRWPASDRALSGRIPVLCAPVPAEGDLLRHALWPVRRMDEELPALLRRVPGPGRRDRCALRLRLVGHLRERLPRPGFRRRPRDPHEHRHRRHDGVRGPPVPRRTDDRGAGSPPRPRAVPQHPGRKHPARAHPVRPRHGPSAPDSRRPGRGTQRYRRRRRRAPVWRRDPLPRPGSAGDLPLRVLGPLRSPHHDGERERGRWTFE